MERITVYIEDKTAYVDTDGEVVKIKQFKTKKECDDFMESVEKGVESRVNVLFLGEKSITDNIREVTNLLRSEPKTTESKALLGIMEQLEKTAKK